MIENIIMSSHAPQIDINGLTVVYRFLALLIKWWCSGTGNRTPTIQTTGRRLSTHGHPSGPTNFKYCLHENTAKMYKKFLQAFPKKDLHMNKIIHCGNVH